MLTKDLKEGSLVKITLSETNYYDSRLDGSSHLYSLEDLKDRFQLQNANRGQVIRDIATNGFVSMNAIQGVCEKIDAVSHVLHIKPKNSLSGKKLHRLIVLENQIDRLSII